MTATVIIEYQLSGGANATRKYSGKFLELTWRGQDYMLFAPPELHRYHNQILAHFLADRGISHRWVTQERLEVNDPQLRVHGGGRFHLDRAQGNLEFWDDSHAYGRFDEGTLVDRVAAAGVPWSELTVKIF